LHVPIFPKLTSLLLNGLDFTDAAPGSGVVYDLVMSVVQWRKVNKTPLTTLCINSCVIKKKQAKALEKIVPDFRWDHVIGFHHSDYCDREVRYDCEADWDSESDDDDDDYQDISDPGVQHGEVHARLA